VRIRRVLSAALAALSAPLIACADPEHPPSTCYGTPENGRLENGVALPRTGPNFRTYSTLGSLLGRTHVHEKVAELVLAAYARLQKTHPESIFVFGETSWPSGGRLRPHRTHQNGTSVDFMVPVRDRERRPVPLPSSPFEKFGYALEFDPDGRTGDLTIDFAALSAHLDALHSEARGRGVSVRRVILAPELQRHLKLTTPIPFTTRKPWIRHDEHYHVDFAVPCKPL
jgi:penicillin-insensitive murein endopeptidase